MTELVLNISKFGYRSLSTTTSQAIRKINAPAKLQDIICLGIILTLIQILDGMMTAEGVARYGTGIEANLFIRNLMEQWGYVNALIAVKTAGVLIVALLCYLALSVNWVTTALRGVIVLYVLAAIIPWTAILFFNIA